ncbi:hypothetical protein AB0I39_33300 [Kitasatospora purpeofusca]|uniref:hypothetical protein n=1 Tax=Kitasatospora purpeofusca TaxID=67352 RepID=UPI00340B7B6E
MRSPGVTNNAVHGGKFSGAVIQARDIHGGIHLINRSIRGAAPWSLIGLLWRFTASLAGCSAVLGAASGGTPLSELAAACDSLTVPANWTIPAAAWVIAHSDGISVVALATVTIGILSLPKPPTSGWDVGRSLEWRSPSTTVMALSVLHQAGWSWWTTVDVGLASALSVWVAGRKPRGGRDRQGIVSVTAASLVLAVVFAPLYVGLWLFARDEPRTE